MYQKLQVFSAVLALGASQFLGCAWSGGMIKPRVRESNDLALRIEQTYVFPGYFSVSYSVRNTSDKCLWVCEGVNGFQKPSIVLRGGTLILQFFSSLPYDSGFLTDSILADYYRLEPGKSAARTIVLDLPASTGPLLTGHHASGPYYLGPRTTQARSVVLQVGSIHEEAFDHLGDYAKRMTAERAVVAVLRPMEIDECVAQARISGVDLAVKR